MIQYKYHPAPSLFCEKWCPQFTQKNREQNTHNIIVQDMYFPTLALSKSGFRSRLPSLLSAHLFELPIYAYHIAFILFCKVFLLLYIPLFLSLSPAWYPEGHGDRYSGTLNAVVRFMPSSVNSASACAFKSASIQILMFVAFPVRTILCTNI